MTYFYFPRDSQIIEDFWWVQGIQKGSESSLLLDLADYNKRVAVLDLYMCLLKRGNALSVPLPELPEEVADKLKFKELVPSLKLARPNQPPLWLPVAGDISLELRLLALIPEARGYLLSSILKDFDPQKFSISDCSKYLLMYDIFIFRSSESLLFATKPSSSIRSNWFQLATDKYCSKISAYSRYIFVEEAGAGARFPPTLNREGLQYTLYAFMEQSSDSLTYSVQGAKPSDGTFSVQKSLPPSKLAIYRCDEDARRYMNAKIDKFRHGESDPLITLSQLGPNHKCTSKFLAHWFVYSLSALKENKKINSEEFKNGNPCLLNRDKKGFEELLGQKINGDSFGHNPTKVAFYVTGTFVIDREERPFYIFISYLPADFDIVGSSLSKSFEKYLLLKDSGKLQHDFRRIEKPQMKHGPIESVQVWNIEVADYFVKTYPLSDDVHLSWEPIFIDEYYKYEPVMVAQVSGSRTVKVYASGQQEVEWDLNDDPINTFPVGVTVLYRRLPVYITDPIWAKKAKTIKGLVSAEADVTTTNTSTARENSGRPARVQSSRQEKGPVIGNDDTFMGLKRSTLLIGGLVVGTTVALLTTAAWYFRG